MKRKIGRLFARVQGVLRRVWHRWFPPAVRAETQLAAPRPETPPPVVSPLVVDLDYEEVSPGESAAAATPTQKPPRKDIAPAEAAHDSAIADLFARVDSFLNMGRPAAETERTHGIDAVSVDATPAVEEPTVPGRFEEPPFDLSPASPEKAPSEPAAPALSQDDAVIEASTAPADAEPDTDLDAAESDELPHHIDAVADESSAGLEPAVLELFAIDEAVDLSSTGEAELRAESSVEETLPLTGVCGPEAVDGAAEPEPDLEPEPTHRIDAASVDATPALEEPTVPGRFEEPQLDLSTASPKDAPSEPAASALSQDDAVIEASTAPADAEPDTDLYAAVPEEPPHRIDAVVDESSAVFDPAVLEPLEVDEAVDLSSTERAELRADAPSEPARTDAVSEEPPPLISDPYYEVPWVEPAPEDREGPAAVVAAEHASVQVIEEEAVEDDLAQLDAAEEAMATQEEREAVDELVAAMDHAAQVEEAIRSEVEPGVVADDSSPEDEEAPAETVAAASADLALDAAPAAEVLCQVVESETAEGDAPATGEVEDDAAVSAMVDAAQAAEAALPLEQSASDTVAAEAQVDAVSETPAADASEEPEGPAPFRNPLPTVEVPNDYMPAAESAHELYQLQLDGFEGPLDLLLHLIKRHHLDIFDIPVAFICERYLAYIKLMEDLDIDVASEFLFMASELLHLKSRMLLPRPEGEATEEDEIDPRAELVRRLLEYQKYKDAAEQFGGFYRLGRDTFDRPAEAVPPPEGEAPLKEVGLFALTKAFQAVLKRQRPEVRHQVMLEQVSVRQRIRTLVQRFESQESVRFDALLEGVQRRIDIVVTFLALLEMGKLKLLRIFQSEDGVIYVHPKFDDASLAFARLEGLDESQYA